MKEYTGKQNIINIDQKMIASLSQNQDQYNNYSITVYEVLETSGDLEAGTVIVREDTIGDCNDYLLDSKELSLLKRDPAAYLNNWAENWARNGEEDYIVECCRWRLSDPEDYAYEGEALCNILVKGCYQGYTPIDRAKDEQGETLQFPNSADAQLWIDEKESKTYYLSHNEAGRPAYTIIEA